MECSKQRPQSRKDHSVGRGMRLEGRQALDPTGFEMDPKSNGRPLKNFKHKQNNRI